MLNDLSSTRQIFEKSKEEYQEALNKFGYNHTLEYKEKINSCKKKSRSRKVVWFNPPYSMHVKTNIGKKFLNLIDAMFPKSHPLSKICNRTCIKVSYRTSPNLGAIIAKHNAKIMKNSQKVQDRECNCRVGKTCPMEG